MSEYGEWKVGRFESYDAITGEPQRFVYRPADVEVDTRICVRGKDCDKHAHLIAAAPKMLDALEAQDALDRHTVKCPRCEELQPCDDGCRLAGIALDLRTAALAKVRGVIA